jgi:hypothetical protein
MTEPKTVGSKAEVFHGTAKHTSGGLKKKDLMKTKAGRIVSRKKHALGKSAIKRLFKAGYKPKKGTFRLMGKSGSMTRRRRGGYDPSSTNALANIVQAASTGSPAGGPIVPPAMPAMGR